LLSDIVKKAGSITNFKKIVFGLFGKNKGLFAKNGHINAMVHFTVKTKEMFPEN